MKAEATDRIETGRTVIHVEAEALTVLADGLGETFRQSVDAILKTRGHLIVVGIGKSGHIGRKISASFASTGTPSFFLHPSEAAHGDLGMVTAECTLLALSFSGESAEVNTVVDYAAELGADVIAITGHADSSLAKKAGLSNILPDVVEACPHALAPTTSTTLTLALGDALCVATMTARGFSPEDFGRRHPAGKLGFGLQRVSQFLATTDTAVPAVAPATAMADVIIEMTRGGKGCVAVVENGALTGIVTDGDLRRAMSADIMTKCAADIMTSSPFTLSPDMRLKDVIAAFTERGIGNAFVVEDGRPTGLIDMKTLISTGYV